MAKTYINNTKYEIVSKFTVSGVVDKHDVIGAIFGQSEGLLGQDMDLRELQKNGKIGRIEITLESKDGKSTGELHVPSSMDMAETCTLAATIETVDKVGPCDSKFETLQIQDKRITKRQEIVDRAKLLLQKMVTEELPTASEITEEVRDKAKMADIVEWGESKLAAGPDIIGSDSIIIVEGRADILTLLKNGIRNIVEMNGANVPTELGKLMESKTVTAFIDGDRGGELNLRKLMAVGKVDFVARATEGKEVEELQRKEIVASLKHKMPTAVFLGERKITHTPVKAVAYQGTERRPARRQYTRERSERAPRAGFERPRFERKTFAVQEPAIMRAGWTSEEKAMYQQDITELANTLKARIFAQNKQLIAEVPVRNLLDELQKVESADAIAMDGIITERLAKTAEKKGVKIIAGIREGNIAEKPATVKIIAYGQ